MSSESPGASSWIVRLSCAASQAEAITERLWEAGSNGVAELSEDPSLLSVSLIAGFDDLTAAEAAAAAMDGVVEVVSDTTWAVTETVMVAVGEATLELDVGTAFGHGHHPTTRGALDALEAAGSKAPLGRVLDAGSGTGVLALGAALLGATSVLGVEVDAAAVDIAETNVARHRPLVGDVIVIEHGDLSSAVDVFDTVVANMLLADLRGCASSLQRCTGQRLIVSGVLGEQVDDTVALFPELTLTEQHLAATGEDHHQPTEWAVLRFDRGNL